MLRHLIKHINENVLCMLMSDLAYLPGCRLAADLPLNSDPAVIRASAVSDTLMSVAGIVDQDIHRPVVCLRLFDDIRYPIEFDDIA